MQCRKHVEVHQEQRRVCEDHECAREAPAATEKVCAPVHSGKQVPDKNRPDSAGSAFVHRFSLRSRSLYRVRRHRAPAMGVVGPRSHGEKGDSRD
jgi:hypothetical protein